jgi:hypothetical protein
VHGVGAGKQRAGRVRRLSAAEARGLSWLAFAREILRLPTSGVRWGADAFVAAALGLAAQNPYIASLEDLAVEVRCVQGTHVSVLVRGLLHTTINLVHSIPLILFTQSVLPDHGGWVFCVCIMPERISCC